MIRVGVDAGGTFTDFVVSDEDGGQRMLKLASRPDDPAAVVQEALRQLVGEGEPVELVFSTTAATNALLERRGGPALLVTTRGFEDVLELGRQARPSLYALEPALPAPLLGAEQRLGVTERMGARGEVVTPLTEGELDGLVARLREADPASKAHVAISLLHAYAQPAHERAIAERLRELGWRVALSSEVCPLPREYERTSTTVIDAYVASTLGATLARLDETVALRVMESSGGARAARAGIVARPARTVMSGPAAGVLAAERVAERLGSSLALALDMGGTSTDVALIRRGRAARVDELAIDGLPIALPSVAVRSVGAGGGSIAWLDDGGALKVGPRSAGAVPGPASYGRGGAEPAVTDAHVVLGRLGGTLSAGTVSLDAGAARRAIGRIATPLGITAEAAAAAIIEVADAALVRAARLAALGEEVDLLIAYGGAAGLHAVAIARALGIGRIVVPIAPGLQCALGALGAEVVVEELRAWSGELDGSARAALSVLEAAVNEALDRDGVEERRIVRVLRARYAGQGLDGELELPVEGFDVERFHRAHQAAYGHRLERDVEIVSLRVRGTSVVRPVVVQAPREIGWARIGTRALVADGEVVRAAVYARARLRAGQRVVGPAIVEEASSTLYLPPGAAATVHAGGELIVSPMEDA